jgi:hypothetical protein
MRQETASSATAKVPHELDAPERREQAADLRGGRREQLAGGAEAELAEPVAALVQPDPVREPAVQRLHAEDVDEELAELVRGSLQSIEPRAPGEERVVVVAHHRGAAAGGADHRLVPAEDLEEASRERGGGVGGAGVRHRLSAAGLLLGEDHLGAEPLEDAGCGQADPRPELVDVARHEERDPHRRRECPKSRSEMKRPAR